jgi:uncharacterized protein involved in exopolysaccharide biosynthesis
MAQGRIMTERERSEIVDLRPPILRAVDPPRLPLPVERVHRPLLLVLAILFVTAATLGIALALADLARARGL